jgi:hypothetical protein
MNKALRNAGRVAVVSMLTVGILPFGALGYAAETRTDTALAGFSVDVEASPVLVLIDDQKAAIPRPTGTAIAEADPNYTLASVSAGPNARAIASTLWPGNLLGTGLPQIAPGAPAYPLKAESRYPDKPFTATGVDGGVLTSSSAEGLDAFAQADGVPTNKPGPLMLGAVTSTSTATVTDKDVALGTAVSAVKNINLLGVIEIGAVTTRLTASADGKDPKATGTTTITGLTIAGQKIGVDETGLHFGPQTTALPKLETPKELKDALGISIEAIVQDNGKQGDVATSVASGLVIRIDTTPLKEILKPGVDAARPLYNQLIDALWPEQAAAYKGYAYYLLNASPNLTFVFGAGKVRAAATLPISFDEEPPPSFPGGPGGEGGGSSGGTVTDPGIGTPTGPDGSTAPPPVLSPPGGDNQASGFDEASFGGIAAPWLLAAIIGSGLIGWALVRFLGLAGGLLGFGCRLGAPTSVPNLRSVTA